MGTQATVTEVLAQVTDSELRRFLTDKWDLIEEHFAPTHFIVFGSRVHGTPTAWSDIDAIIVSPAFSPIRIVNRSYHFKKAIRPHIGMDVLCYTPDEFENLRTGVGVVADACSEGLWLK
jgi:hypothetical protein